MAVESWIIFSITFFLFILIEPRINWDNQNEYHAYENNGLVDIKTMSIGQKRQISKSTTVDLQLCANHTIFNLLALIELQQRYLYVSK